MIRKLRFFILSLGVMFLTFFVFIDNIYGLDIPGGTTLLTPNNTEIDENKVWDKTSESFFYNQDFTMDYGADLYHAVDNKSNMWGTNSVFIVLDTYYDYYLSFTEYKDGQWEATEMLYDLTANNITVIRVNATNIQLFKKITNVGAFDYLYGDFIQQLTISKVGLTKSGGTHNLTLIGKKKDSSTIDYNKGYADGKRDADAKGYDNAYNDGYNSGKNDGYISGKNDGYDDGYDYGYGVGYDMGVLDNPDSNFGAIISATFSGVGSILSVELLPNITIGAIVAVPLVFGVVAFIMGRRKD